jgi:hypothetical protein
VSPVDQQHSLFKKEIFLDALIVVVMLEVLSILSVQRTTANVRANPRSKEEGVVNPSKPITSLLCINISMKLKMEEQSLILLLDSVMMKVSSQVTPGEDTQLLRLS